METKECHPYADATHSYERKGNPRTMQAAGDTTMKILVMGAGAIGSLFGAYLSRTNDVVLLGRTTHIDAIEQKGLRIRGKTTMHCCLPTVDSVQKNIRSPGHHPSHGEIL